MKPPLDHTFETTAALRRKWEEGREPTFLGWITMMDPAVAEIMVEWGYDGLIIDTEHSTFNIESLRAVLMAFRGTDCVPIVRVGDNDQYLLKQILDLGAGGVLIPLIQDAADARAAVDNCRYPPLGNRGVSPRRASNYFRNFETYAAEANRSLILMIQIECVPAYENLDAILAVQGIDACFVGQVDLSTSMGHMGDVRHPDVAATVEDIIRRTRQANRAAGIAAFPIPERIQHWIEVGTNVVAFGSEMGYMLNGFNAFKSELQDAGVPFAQTGD
jgi:2-keto-3-deoxy-L-rhamnonate aldolase RhmA